MDESLLSGSRRGSIPILGARRESLPFSHFNTTKNALARNRFFSEESEGKHGEAHFYETLDVQHELGKESSSSRRKALAGMCAYFAFGLWIGHIQGWSLTDSFYTCVVTFTTVGYGDFDFGAEDSNEQLSGAALIVLGVVTFGAAISILFGSVMEEEQAVVVSRAQARDEGKDITVGATCWQRIRAAIRQYVAPQKHSTVGLADFMREEAIARLKVSLIVSVLREVSILIFGASILGSYEEWSWRTSLYWAVTTAATVGYGDVVPTTEVGRLVASFLILLSVYTWTQTLAFVAGYRTLMSEVRARHEVLTQFGTTLTEEEFETLTHGEEVRALRLSSDSSNITKAEFCLYMLVKMGRVSREELLAVQDAFDVLDITFSGKLEKRTLLKHEQRRKDKYGNVDDGDQDSSTTDSPPKSPERSFYHQLTTDDADADTTCSKCGNIYMPDSTFCRKCGKPRRQVTSSRSVRFDND